MKLQIYRRTLRIGFLVILLVWAISAKNNMSSDAEKIILPFFALYCLIASLIFNKHGVAFISMFEYLGFTLVFLYFFSQFYLEVQASLENPFLDFRKFLLWISILYAFAFLIFPPRKALLWSFVYLFSIFWLGFYYYFAKKGHPSLGHDTLLLMQIYGSGLIYISLLYAIAKLKEKYAKEKTHSDMMSILASTDVLTGALSRVGIEKHLEAYIMNTTMHDQPLSILVFDLDKLKHINDTYGHREGDQVLKRSVEILSKNLRSHDLLGRIGGDEFLLVCPDTTKREAMKLAKRLEAAISSAEVNKAEVITISVGVATFQTGDTQESLFIRADKAMYAHKQSKYVERRL